MFHDPNNSTDGSHHVHPCVRNPTLSSAYFFHRSVIGIYHFTGSLASGISLSNCHCTLGTLNDSEDDSKEEQWGETRRGICDFAHAFQGH